jgi:hypothetical protein
MTVAFHDVFLVGAGIAVIAFVSVLFLKEVPLRSGSTAAASTANERHGAAAGAAGLAD